MMGLNKVVIADYERGLKYTNRRLTAVLAPGVYRWLNRPNRKVEVQVVDVTTGRLQLPRIEYLVRNAPEAVAAQFEVVAIGPQELGLVYLNGRLNGLLQPGAVQVFWKDAADLRVERVDLSDSLEVDPKRVQEVLRSGMPTDEKRTLYLRQVADHEAGLLLIDGRFERLLEPGLHGFWAATRPVTVELVDLRLQALEVSGQEMLTKDKVSLRINLAAGYRVTDPVKARAGSADVVDQLYRTLQFGLRQAVGGRDLERLLGQKGELDDEVFAYAAAQVEGLGLSLEAVGVKDIILPGDMKAILNQVVEAQKVSEANVIRRREETAATRSLLNTAKLMDDNPTLLRLKELEILEKVTEKIDQITVFGGLEGVLNELVKIGGQR
ncbi:MAG: slipin family protein [Pseudomonadota bacterium]